MFVITKLFEFCDKIWTEGATILSVLFFSHPRFFFSILVVSQFIQFFGNEFNIYFFSEFYDFPSQFLYAWFDFASLKRYHKLVFILQIIIIHIRGKF